MALGVTGGEEALPGEGDTYLRSDVALGGHCRQREGTGLVLSTTSISTEVEDGAREECNGRNGERLAGRCQQRPDLRGPCVPWSGVGI